MPPNLENSTVATGLERSVFIPIPKKGNAKECSNYHTIALISHVSKLMRKIFQVRHQQYVTMNFQMFKLDLKRTEESEIKLPTSLKKQETSRKTYQFSSVQSLSRVQLFATPWIAARQASLSITNSQSSLRLTSTESVMPSNHLILCRPLLLLPPIPPSIRVFSNESTLRMR